MHNIEENVRKLLDNYSENRRLVNESKKNIKSKLTIFLVSLVTASFTLLLLINFELPVVLVSMALAIITPQIVSIKSQGTYYKNVKNIVNARKDMEKHLNEFKESKDKELIKEKTVIKDLNPEIEKHNLRQKELEIAFSDENYYPYIERIKAKTLKR